MLSNANAEHFSNKVGTLPMMLLIQVKTLQAKPLFLHALVNSENSGLFGISFGGGGRENI